MSQYTVILVFIVFGIIAVMLPLVLGALLRPSNPYREKNMPYECGKDPVGKAQGMFPIRIYVVALAFLIFDVEFVTLVPVALQLKQVGLIAVVEVFTFLSVLALGLAYLWKHGHLEWAKNISE